jgi:radical SAM superfamily enzyme YgiQ (UPF0313 family)
MIKKSLVDVLLVAVNTIKERDFVKVRKRGTAHALPPLGVLFIASYLKTQGINTHVLDTEQKLLTDQETINLISRTLPKGAKVGWPLWIITVDRTARIISQLKKIRPDLGQFVGGPHASALPIKTMEKYGDLFDYLIVGEGELPATELIKHWGENRYLEKIPGIVFKEKKQLRFLADNRRGYTRTIKPIKEEIISWPQHAKQVDNLDQLPIPQYRMLGDLSCYHLSEFTPPVGEKQLSMITSRGCPFACFFCDQEVSGHKYRSLSPKRIIKYMIYLRDLGVDYFYITNDVYLVNLDQVEETARRILETPKLKNCRLEIITRADLTEKAAQKKVTYRGRRIGILDLLFESGCRQAHIAPETGNEKLRREAIGKQISNAQIEKAVQALAKAKISIKLLNMVGLPGETPKETMETLKYIQKLGEIGASYAMISVCTPLPSTPLALAIQNGQLGWTGDLDNWESMNFWDPAGVFTTDIRGHEVCFTPENVLRAARGKHRLGRLITQQDRQRGETLEQKLNLVQKLINDQSLLKRKNAKRRN